MEFLTDNLIYIVLVVIGFLASRFLNKSHLLDKAREVKEKKGEVNKETEIEIEETEDLQEEVKERQKDREDRSDELDEDLKNHF